MLKSSRAIVPRDDDNEDEYTGLDRFFVVCSVIVAVSGAVAAAAEAYRAVVKARNERCGYDTDDSDSDGAEACVVVVRPEDLEEE